MKYVVGIGASAGGLDALNKFFKHMPVCQEAAFVVIQHLSPEYKSMMKELLAKYTKMPLHVAEEGMLLEGGHIYLIPPNHELTIRESTLYLKKYDENIHLKMPINIFLESLAEDKGRKAIAVILSGTGSDGSEGIIHIREREGIVIAQDEFSAQFNGMPKSAIYTGGVDFILSPEEMGKLIIAQIERQSKNENKRINTLIEPMEDESINAIYEEIKLHTEMDLSVYKQKSIERRIELRMSQLNMKDKKDYTSTIRDNPTEIDRLFQELFIGVTQFFRDKEVFVYMKDKVIPKLVETIIKEKDDELRIWISACSTGEEAYSILILILEYMRIEKLDIKVKIFASDLNVKSIQFAAEGIFGKEISKDIPKDYLKRYFEDLGVGFRVKKKVREKMIFSVHNVFEDPPFNRMHMITCRNLLIYFQPMIQKKILSLFDYALKTGGILVLGMSETVGKMDNLFKPMSLHLKIFEHVTREHTFSGQFRVKPAHIKGKTSEVQNKEKSILSQAGLNINQLQAALVKNCLPASIVVNSKGIILLIIGNANQYLSIQAGEPSLNIVDLLDEKIASFLVAALTKIFVQEGRIEFNTETQGQQVKISVALLKDSKLKENVAIIEFIEKHIEKASDQVEILDTSQAKRIEELEKELMYTRESLQAVNEELETSNEELQATNEELMSANEELQSTNEELQSVNEELISLNSEYQEKISQLVESNDDMTNLLNNTNIGTLFLDTELKIRRYTPALIESIHLLKADIGRSINDIALDIEGEHIVEDSKQVLRKLVPIERVVTNRDGKTFLEKAQPYRTSQNFISGIVITFVDITERSTLKKRLEHILENGLGNDNFLTVSDAHGFLLSVNKGFLEYTNYQLEDVIGRHVYEFWETGMNDDVREDIWTCLGRGEEWSGTLIHRCQDGKKYREYAHLYPMRTKDGMIGQIIKVARLMEDVKG